jgi:hypothetical protein
VFLVVVCLFLSSRMGFPLHGGRNGVVIACIGGFGGDSGDMVVILE